MTGGGDTPNLKKSVASLVSKVNLILWDEDSEEQIKRGVGQGSGNLPEFSTGLSHPLRSKEAVGKKSRWQQERRGGHPEAAWEEAGIMEAWKTEVGKHPCQCQGHRPKLQAPTKLPGRGKAANKIGIHCFKARLTPQNLDDTWVILSKSSWKVDGYVKPPERGAEGDRQQSPKEGAALRRICRQF